MSSVAVRIPRETHEKIRAIAEERQVTVGTVISEWAEAHEEEKFWHIFERSVAQLRADQSAWEEMQSEQRELDGTLSDGLEPETWGNE